MAVLYTINYCFSLTRSYVQYNLVYISEEIVEWARLTVNMSLKAFFSTMLHLAVYLCGVKSMGVALLHTSDRFSANEGRVTF